MLTILLRVLTLVPFFASLPLPQVQAGGNQITTPAGDSTVMGVVQVTGTAGGEGFKSYSLSYAYEGMDTPNWFPLADSDQPVNSGLLGAWDTTTITDGNYSLRLIVQQQDGTQAVIIRQNIQVRNYTSVDGALSTAGDGSATANDVAGAVTEPAAAVNPVSLLPSELKRTAVRGAAAGAGAILLAGLYVLLRRASRR